MEKPAIKMFFTYKDKTLNFEILRADKFLFGSIAITSGIFKLEHCSFDISEAIQLLKIVRSFALNTFTF